MTLHGQHVLVMGGSSGIGAASARRLAAQGAAVTITGRDESKLAATAAGIDGKVITARLDATDPAQIAGFFAADTVYDHLVLALSGASGAGPLATLDLDDLAAGFDGKFWPHVRILQAALPHLSDRASLTIITAASARSALPGTAGLAAINGALEAMVPPLAAELAPRRVNAISPGVIDTPWWSGLSDAERQATFDGFSAMLPLKRVGTADEVAHTVEYAVSNGYLTGSVLECDGGAHLGSAG
ncbi:MAG TPA: SDR family oxidoreductase [Stackebrandtia sp.]|uniref:SDR family oxidoreductase n=1 Tax=Stackebrandtia sp. TaxID=2023065 RepID=UPI002D63F025|nr:SDR family oxidoreductase [Stackebrandtia sp.]HZE41282.1 SDR family oxidoreductase [Stackebrandtia sp.]